MSDEIDSIENPKKKFIIERQPNPDLWQKLQEQWNGTEESRLQTMETIISRIRELPEDADQLLISISKTGSLLMKRRMAVIMASKPSIPWGLWLDLIQNLGEEDDLQVKESVDPLLQPYRQLAESIKTWQERVIGSIPKNLFSSIASQQAAIQKALAPMEEVQRSIQTFFQLNLPTEQISKTLESLAQIQIPRVQLPKGVLDSIGLVSQYHNLAYGNIARLSPSYYPPEEEPLSAKASDHPLIIRLRGLPPGQETWPEYQKLCQEILSFCFVPPLLESMYEESTESGIHRRDVIYHIPHDASGFWSYVKTAHSALAVIVDAKNYTSILPKNQIVITSKYFGPKKLGSFGIIVCRKGLDSSGNKELADRWIHHDEMIVCLTDDDLEEMVGLKLAGEDAEYVIDRKIRDLRSAL